MIIFVLPIAAFFVVFFLLPLGMVVLASLFDPVLTGSNYQELFTSLLYVRVLRSTLEISGLSTIMTLLIAYPVAYHLYKQPPRRRTMLMTLVLLPFWTSILVKSFAFTVLLGQDGVINTIARALFGPETGLKLLFNRPGVIIGMAHYLLPFMIFAILTSLMAQNPDLRRAAEVMGAGRLKIFRSITLPLSLPGVGAGCLICIVLSLGMFVTPALLGGPKDMMLANLVEMHIRQTLDWGLAAALTVMLIVMTAALSALISRIRGGGLGTHG
ncbi:ABC transporter permease [Mesorhizobium sp. BR1-1-2]|uniref:ABC transporter permease n=1 Tax=Mesorhizobium sp. BR1-1-2 TaxID=2876652 RepID=UPI001CCA4C0E|nr:ABC transporter permease [Mesorhizobium sp. BR1-1-2]MBZ9964651.1 ABC transporter permease [Mesorhizobium sp. BR1-1-2]